MANKSNDYLNGWLAHKNNVDSEANPYDEQTQARPHVEWTSGWSARFSCIKHGWALEHDDDLYG